MKFKVSHVALIVIAALCIGLSACTEEIYVQPKVFGQITGKVVDNATKKPLGDVLIKLNPSGRSIQTDTSGNFAFDSLVAGKYTISTEKKGLYNEYVNVEVTDVQNPVVTIYMSEDLKSNRPPTKPSIPIPAVGAAVSGINNVLLSWTSTDPDRDTLTFDVYLFKDGGSPSIPFITSFGNDSLYVNNLEYDKTYYWQVVAKDKREKVYSEIWSFTTPKFPSLSYVFTRETAGKYDIYAANDDKSIVRLTTEGSNWRPIVSPDREKIAFISNRSTSLHIYIINRDGTGLKKVTTVPIAGLSSLDLSFSWANNGSKIIYPSNNKLYSVNTDGTGQTEVAKAAAGRQYAGVSWNDATKVIVARTTGETVYDNQLELIYTSGFRETVLTSSRRVGNPVFSIDGGEFLFSMDMNVFQNEAGRQVDASIFEFYLPGKTTRNLSTTEGSNTTTSLKPKGTNDLDPRYSPDGQQIIFTNVINDDVSIPSLYIADLDGRNRNKIITNAEMGYWRQQ